MAEKFPLSGLEDELSCSICLSPFDCPVTIPCGHNFCQDCLLATWEDCTYSCPQCRTIFSIRPELKKNTVLSTVVEAFKQKSSTIPTEKETKAEEPSKPEEKHVVLCDACMEAEASKTCLTCMASYCEEHLRPHRENPIFRVHQLNEPIGNLIEHICPDHSKLMELYCVNHDRLICSSCLQQAHKGCSFSSPEEQRSLKESDLKSKLELLDAKIIKNETVLSQVKIMQVKLKDSATSRKKTLAVEYQQVRDMLTREENEASNALDREVESGQMKIRTLMKKFSENVENMKKAKEDICRLLGQSQTHTFLQTSFTLPQAVTFEPYMPRITLDSNKVMAAEIFPAVLKKHLTEMFEHPVSARIQMLTPGPGATSWSPLTPRTPQQSEPGSPIQNPQSKVASKKKPSKGTKSSDASGLLKNELTKSMENLVEFRGKSKSKEKISEIPRDIASAEKRNELMKFGFALTFDPRTAHKRIILTEDFTKASVSDESTNYPECPERFAVCSQVFATPGFIRGRHYWEVRLSCNNFIGLGLAYGSIDRKGPTSRLGRNNRSWCVEWFNVKLSAWHNSVETVLANPSPKRVGVLLDCEEGRATFYNVADRAYPFHSFSLPCVEPVYPAFWVFSSGSSVTLCKLQ
ncbi:E3 ubiquitin/ISG15 ligase TRIM25 isoform X2 [Oryzias melastigma]|uniref:Tripartite motif containing 25 n=1 Tax=Oryzias melastigma TaxID=30732 RepID=A0A3B3CTV9_ORYME|nr:E3 ubiquitin/ISG15 ligase TRIM25 isoform X2 [Oryzias melastigma]